MLIAGEWVEAEGGGTIAVDNPATGEIVGHVPLGSKEDARKAVDAAVDSQPRIAKMLAHQRSKTLISTAKLIQTHFDEVCRLISTESGKPIRDAEVEVKRAINTFTFAGEEAKRIYGEVQPADAYELPPGNENRLIFSVREPVGTVAAIGPFNYPLNLLAHKIAPAIAAGNSVVAKPASETPLTALRLAEFMVEAGCPPGVLNVVTGPGSTVGVELAENPKVNLITFTGETTTGIDIAQHAAKNVKRVILEMGGMDPLIVLDDANVEEVAEAALRGCYTLAGQVCTAVKRILAMENIADALTKSLAIKVQRLRVGNPLDRETDVGPMINQQAVRRIHGLVEDAENDGASLVVGGKPLKNGQYAKGSFYAPTILDEVKHGMRIAQVETFGPLAPIQRMESTEQLLEVANGTIYGLQACVYTKDYRRALKIARELKVGGVMINDPSNLRWDNMPFGGMKMSGLGREGVRFAIQEMAEVKLISVNLA